MQKILNWKWIEGGSNGKYYDFNGVETDIQWQTPLEKK
jgi:hypothetical protein